jgi:aspartyl-tRNA(Asn)/glutamyl-tRNA(Gln) amidotransferase subunit C
MEINDKLLSKLATLARINIEDSKKEKMKKDLSEIISWMEKLQEVDTSEVEPLTNMSREINRWRKDTPGKPMDRDIALGNAPLNDDKFFKVPKVLKNK